MTVEINRSSAGAINSQIIKLIIILPCSYPCRKPQQAKEGVDFFQDDTDRSLRAFPARRPV
jgi:hypothetical protein